MIPLATVSRSCSECPRGWCRGSPRAALLVSLVVSLVVFVTLASGCTKESAENAPAPATSAERETPESSYFRLVHLGVLHAERDTAVDSALAIDAFRKAFALRSEPAILLDIARVYCLAQSWPPRPEGEDTGATGGAKKNRAPVPVEYESTSEGALAALREVRERVPEDRLPADVFYLEGMAFQSAGNTKEAVDRFRVVTERAPDVIPAWFLYGSALWNEGKLAEAIEALEKVVAADPRHRAATYKIWQAYIRLRDTEAQKKWQERFAPLASVRVDERDFAKCRFTRIEIEPPARTAGEPEPVTLSFRAVELPGGGALQSEGIAVLPPEEEGERTAPELVVFGGGSARSWTASDGGFKVSESVLTDWAGASRVSLGDATNDGEVDAVLAGPEGLRFEPANRSGATADGPESPSKSEGGDVTEGQSPVAPSLPVRFGDAGLVLDLELVDYDHDGDLDLVTLEAKNDTLSPQVRRNNGDGTWALVDVLPGTLGSIGVRERCRFAVADLDRGNDTDFVFPSPAGSVVVYLNLRDGPFQRAEIGGLDGHARVLAFDADNDGDFDIIGLPRESATPRVPFRIAWNDGGAAPTELPSFRVESQEGLAGLGAVHGASAADLDNDGDLDLVLATAAGVAILRNQDGGHFASVAPRGLGPASPGGSAAMACNVADLDCDGLLDIAVIASGGDVRVYRQTTENPYLSTVLALRGGRDNRLGTGAHVEIFAGSGYQRILADGPRGAFVGLGVRERKALDGVSITWPNGIRQALLAAELDPGGCNRVRIIQRVGLVVSCPFLYVFDGERWRFLTDVVAIAPLDEWVPPGGAPHLDPEEYVRIPGDLLRPTGGRLRAVLTEELRETTYLDRAELIRVVHPEGTIVYTDESTRQGAVEPLRVCVVREDDLELPVRVRSSLGAEAGDLTTQLDRRYFKPYRESPSQWAGWVEPFALEIELPESWRHGNPPVSPALLLTGRVAWQDSGVSYALDQSGRTWSPHTLEYVDEDGSTRIALADVGFPSGMDRTMVVPLEHLEGAHSLRLSATSRLFWDCIAFSRDARFVELADAGEETVPSRGAESELTLVSTRHSTLRADLDFRGYSEISGDFAAHEHVYDFDRVSAWRDFPLPEGNATRYGDVRELVSTPDDRLVVFSPGDALTLEFDAGEPPPPQHAVTYFLKLTGWAKEAGFHNSTGRTIEPLPFRAMTSYPEGARAGPDTPEYREYLETWETRRVTNVPGSPPR